MSKMLIDLSNEDATLLRELAEQHGHKVKPFVEYLVRMQLGTAPPPTVRPVKIQPRTDTIEKMPEKVQPIEDTKEREPLPEQPAKGEALKAARPPEALPEASNVVSRNASEYTKRTEYPNISTNGAHFFVSLLGQRSFHATIEEAKAARIAIREFPQ